MKSEVVVVSSKGRGMDDALAQADKAVAQLGLSPREALHMRLLVEEMMSMVRSIIGELEGKFWIETEDSAYRLYLQMASVLGTEQRKQLISASTSGKNAYAKGIMGRLRDFFDRNADQDVVAFTNPIMMSGVYDNAQDILHDVEWSMVKYRDDIYSTRDENAEHAAAWDELEKSVITHVADEIKVFIHNQQAEMVVYKKLA